MSEDKDLLDRIAKISGQINIHRTRVPSAKILPHQSHAEDALDTPHSSAWRSQRSVPYPQGRRRGGHVGPISHRNRSLVMNNKINQPAVLTNENDVPDQKDGYVTKHDRHMQLINTSVYEKEARQRNRAIEESRRQKILEQDRREQERVQQHFDAGSAVRETTINGIRFRVTSGGNKLERDKDILDPTRRTPKQAIIGGVKFFRTTNGNLIRSGIAKATKNSGNFKKIFEPCKRFTSTGLCPKGPRCPYIHDPAKVAMCKNYLRTGSCSLKPEPCHLSHDPTPERVPACLHFLRGNCNNVTCRYAHVHVNPSAPVCKAFATIGYCSKGASCSDRHVHECPDYTNNGVCRNRKCHLPHVDRADQMKKHAIKEIGPIAGSAESDDDLVSEEDDELGTDDVDSDSPEELMTRTDASHALSQQQDFVHF